MEHKQTEATITAVDEAQGIVEAIWAVMGNVDQGGDIIHPGAFRKTFNERAGQVKLLDNHRTDSVLSALGTVLELREVSPMDLPADLKQRYPEATGGAYGRFQFLLDTPEGKGAFTRIQRGALREWSFGYDTIQRDVSSIDKDGRKVNVRNLREIKLYEVSPVLFPMNEATLTTGVKSQEEEPPTEDKAGRVLSGRNAARIQAALDALNETLKEAGLLEVGEDSDDSKDGWLCDACYKALGKEYECFTDTPLPSKCAHCGKKEARHHLVKLPTGPQQSDEAPTSDAKEAGPLEADSTRIKSLIQFELEKMKLLEV